MRTSVPDKLLKVVKDIEERGAANLTRLTVLKKWFERPDRLSSFAIFIAQRACEHESAVEESDAAELLRESKSLLAGVASCRPDLSRKSAAALETRLHAFQDEYKRLAWGAVRIIRNRNLYLIEEGLRIYLRRTDSPSDGYPSCRRVLRTI